jgi:hypothetical protein
MSGSAYSSVRIQCPWRWCFQDRFFPTTLFWRQQLRFNDSQQCYIVMPNSKALLLITCGARSNGSEVPEYEFNGVLSRVQIQCVLKGPKKKAILLYYGKIRDLTWDPTRLQRPGNLEFMQYSTKLGRKLLRQRHPPL